MQTYFNKPSTVKQNIINHLSVDFLWMNPPVYKIHNQVIFCTSLICFQAYEQSAAH